MLIYKDVRSAKQADGTYGGPDGIVSQTDDLVRLSNRSNPYSVTANLSAEYKDFSITRKSTPTGEATVSYRKTR